MADRPAGEKVRREVLGDAHVDRAAARTTAFTADFQDFITRCLHAAVYAGCRRPTGPSPSPSGHSPKVTAR